MADQCVAVLCDGLANQRTGALLQYILGVLKGKLGYV